MSKVLTHSTKSYIKIFFCWNFGRVYLQISGLFPRRYIMEFFVNPNITGFLDNH